MVIQNAIADSEQGNGDADRRDGALPAAKEREPQKKLRVGRRGCKFGRQSDGAGDAGGEI